MLSSLNLNHVIEQISKDKGIKRQILVDTLESAILTAAKKVFGPQRELEAQFDDETGVVRLWQLMEVVDEIGNPFREITMETAHQIDEESEAGDVLGMQIFYREEDSAEAEKTDEQFGDILALGSARKGFGRIAAQTAKQVIIQRVREAEREIVFNEYKDRQGELITGIARRFERGNIIVDLGRAEAILPVREQCPRESYRPGDRVQAFVLEVVKDGRGPQIILSRNHIGLLKKLFEVEVPEIYEGIVSIRQAAREPGARSKIAVASRDSDVDPVGACVGMKGSRVQAVVQELRGEKIDIIPFDLDPVRFVINAIQPADVSKVIMDSDVGVMELIVPDDQLSLAIGRKGQNVRLASQLTGWRLDILSETKVEEMEARARELMLGMDCLNEERVEDFFRLGYTSIESLAESAPEEISLIPGITMQDAEAIIAAAREALEQQRLLALNPPEPEPEPEAGADGEAEAGSEDAVEAGSEDEDEASAEDEDEDDAEAAPANGATNGEAEAAADEEVEAATDEEVEAADEETEGEPEPETEPEATA